LRGFLKGFADAGRGIVHGVRQCRNQKVMLAAAVAVAALGLWLKVSPLEWCVLILAMGLVQALELMNTAGERLVDFVCPEHDERCGLVKDLLAGGVLVSALAAAAVGAVIFLPKLLS